MQERRPFSEAEYLRLRDASTDLGFRFLLDILWLTGSRVSEGLALRPRDLHRVDGEYFLRILRLKHKQKKRHTLPVPFDFGTKLDDFVRLRQLAPDDPLFAFSRWTVRRRVQKLGERVLGRPAYPHMLRHGRCYDLACKGIHPFLVAKLLGHASIQTTLQYYHPDDQVLRDAISR